MKGYAICYVLFPILFVAFLVESAGAAEGEKDGVYIVYMGAATGSSKNDHAQLLSSVLKRRKNALVQSYVHGISGFAARLSAAEAQSIAKTPGVVSVFRDPVYQLHTTRSWDFLKYGTDVVIDSSPNSDSNSSSGGYDSIIGILDTGISPESESFSGKDLGPIPSRWNGTCVDAHDFCNGKIIGARAYNSPDDDDDDDRLDNTPRDMIGHGTHVASTAAGTVVPDASYYGLATGTAKGGSPGSRIAMYRVCTRYGCLGSSILAAFSDAIKDGVDILSLSLGSPASLMLDYKEDPIAIGAYHAVENGITVVCSAGNDGPSEETVTNVAPWILTVAATTIDRKFESNVVLDGGKVIKGEAINFANIGTSPIHPLVYGKSAKKTDASESEARNCNPDSMDGEMIKGKIVLCYNDDDSYSFYDKEYEVQSLGGIGLVLVDDKMSGVASNYNEFPLTVISSKDAPGILSYLNSTKNPVATILPSTVVSQYKPAPTIAYFSSRGPSSLSRNILKPDIAAPGVDILAAWMANDTEVTLKGKESPKFNIISGTSMSCPHVSGMAAVVKSQYPSWSPSAIKSAIMSTASQINNMKAPITAELGAIATAYDYGAGEISTSGALQPGLVYETTTTDYLNFLCYHGYNTSTIEVISKDVPDGFTCPKESSVDLISNINYPSIAVFNLTGKQSKNITRTLTNVAGDGNSTYSLTIEAPSGLTITVSPTSLQFTKNSQRLSYQVIFTTTVPSLPKDVFGSIIWTNKKLKVRTPFVASSR
ncbi:CO(2)-response secreted protease-like [Populus nigra]|uniref:CO(2)-response secreted protease-like n=1 Tax=Populus nigra TaxID=3691 RepID=UPI002B274575|nr:CO(2)-response secreted protease-like [Populus nigra]